MQGTIWLIISMCGCSRETKDGETAHEENQNASPGG